MANEFVMEIEMNAEDKMSKTVNSLKENMGSIRAGRANPKVLDKVLVEYYGTMSPIVQVANISVPEPRILLISQSAKRRLNSLPISANSFTSI